MTANETSFTHIAGVPVHYDRLASPFGYGSEGKNRTLFCTNKLRNALESCFSELFQIWNRKHPKIILSAGTIGDGDNAHGRGLAFDLDGFLWTDDKFMMKDYPRDRAFYIGINAHLFMYFSQVLNYHYPRHEDHFHVDFNFSYSFRTTSNAQTLFLQSALKYVFGRDIGTTGPEKDGVDGIYGTATRPAVGSVLKDLGLSGVGGITVPGVWSGFLRECRYRAF